MTDPYDGPWAPADCGRCGNSGVIPATRHSPPELCGCGWQEDGTWCDPEMCPGCRAWECECDPD